MESRNSESGQCGRISDSFRIIVGRVECLVATDGDYYTTTVIDGGLGSSPSEDDLIIPD